MKQPASKRQAIYGNGRSDRALEGGQLSGTGSGYDPDAVASMVDKAGLNGAPVVILAPYPKSKPRPRSHVGKATVFAVGFVALGILICAGILLRGVIQ